VETQGYLIQQHGSQPGQVLLLGCQAQAITQHRAAFFAACFLPDHFRLVTLDQPGEVVAYVGGGAFECPTDLARSRSRMAAQVFADLFDSGGHIMVIISCPTDLCKEILVLMPTVQG
jgi:hypothetical protein